MNTHEIIDAGSRAWRSPGKLAHVVLRTNDAPRLVDWYCKVLEAQVAMGNPLITFLTYDEEHHRIAIAQIPGVTAAPPMAIGVDHIAFTYNTPEDLFATYERLKAEEISPYWTINHGPTVSFYYRDPDGNQIEQEFDIQEDAACATNGLRRAILTSIRRREIGRR